MPWSSSPQAIAVKEDLHGFIGGDRMVTVSPSLTLITHPGPAPYSVWPTTDRLTVRTPGPPSLPQVHPTRSTATIEEQQSQPDSLNPRPPTWFSPDALSLRASL